MIVNTNQLRRRNGAIRGLGLTVGYTPAQQAMADAFAKEFGPAPSGGPTSVYDVPGLLLSAPDCTQASGGAFVSSACVDKALAVQQQNFQRTADYNAGLLKLPVNPITIAPPQQPPPSIATPTNIVNQVNNQPPVSQINQMATSSGGIMDTVSMASLGSDISIFGYQVPLLAIGVVVIGGLYVLSGRH